MSFNGYPDDYFQARELPSLEEVPSVRNNVVEKQTETQNEVISPQIVNLDSTLTKEVLGMEEEEKITRDGKSKRYGLGYLLEKKKIKSNEVEFRRHGIVSTNFQKKRKLGNSSGCCAIMARVRKLSRVRD
jgi:hypothetical protein